MSQWLATLPAVPSFLVGTYLPEMTMNQVELALTPEAQPPHDDPAGFRIGWDHAHHGLVPPSELLLEGTPIGQGWRAARAVYGGRCWPASRHTRQWLALRIEAWRSSAAFDLQTVTPNHLAQIEARHCPVLRCALGGAAGPPGAACIVRLNPQAAYAAGNLAMMSQAASLAWQGLGVMDLVRRAHAAELAEARAGLEHLAAARPTGRASMAIGPDAAPPSAPELDAAAWWRLATLRGLATPMHSGEAARLPLAVLPPNRVRVLNGVQALQALLTLRLAGPDWCAQITEVAVRLPEHTLRTDFNLWVGAVAPRLLEAQAQGRNLVRALEDAWLAERVQRRWLHFALGLSEPACEQLVQLLARQRLAGRAAHVWPFEQATDGWALAAGNPHPGSALVGGGISSAANAAPAAPVRRARPAGPRKTARTPYAPPLRVKADPRPATR